MSYQLKRQYTAMYDRHADALMSQTERKLAEDAIALDPGRWPVIRDSGGCQKARIPLAGRGKSGGARVIYFFAARRGFIAFIDVYAKNEKENLSEREQKAIRAFVAEIKRGR